MMGSNGCIASSAFIVAVAYPGFALFLSGQKIHKFAEKHTTLRDTLQKIQLPN